MCDLEDYLSMNFKERSMGLVFDFASEIEKPFKEYCGALSGVIGKTKCKSMEEMHNKL